MDHSKFKNALHPSAEMRGVAIDKVLEQKGIEPRSKAAGACLSAAMGVFNLSELFLYRQYYHRDMALKALESGDVEEAKRHLNEIGNSGHHFNNGEKVAL